jgi:hypothetical protein
MASAAALVSPNGPASALPGSRALKAIALALIAPVALDRSALFARISWGTPPVRGVSAHARPRRVAPDVTASRPEVLRRLRFNISELSTVSTDRWGVIPGPNEQPETPPGARTPNLPGDFVSEELRADCTRFLEAIHALVGRRAEMLGAKTGWVPNPPPVTVEEDVDTPPR